MSPARLYRRRRTLVAIALASAATFIAASLASPTVNGLQLAAAAAAIYAVVQLANDENTTLQEVTR